MENLIGGSPEFIQFASVLNHTSKLALSPKMSALPGYQPLEVTSVLEGTTQQLVQLVIDAIKSGKKKVGPFRRWLAHVGLSEPRLNC